MPDTDSQRFSVGVPRRRYDKALEREIHNYGPIQQYQPDRADHLSGCVVVAVVRLEHAVVGKCLLALADRKICTAQASAFTFEIPITA
jgi:hypothetical protein